MSLKKRVVAAFAAFVLMFVLPSSALELGWSGGPMSASGDTIRTDGNVVWAYCGGQADLETFTVNGVDFTAVKKLDSIPSDLRPFPLTLSPCIFMDYQGYGKEGLSDEAYAHLLDAGWWLNQEGEFSFTLKDLVPNKTYLVQLTFHKAHPNEIYHVWAPDGQSVRVGSDWWSEDKDQWKYGGTLYNVFMATSDTYTFKLKYEKDDNKAFLSSIQLRDVSAEPMVIKPTIRSVSAKPHVGKVTISLADVLRGSDAQGVAASSYSVVCAVDGGNPETVLEGQTEAKVKFDLEGLEDGEHTLDVSILNDKGVASETVTLAFSTEIPLGWTAEPMDVDGDAISLDGDLVFAYSSQKDVEVKGIAFKGKSDFRASNAFGSSDGFYRDETEHAVSPPVADSAYGSLLAWSFWIQSGARTMTLNNLEPGEKYLVQLICCNSTKSGKFFAPESTETYVKPCGDGWTYGGTLVGVFIASAADMTFALNMDGASAVNAIQLRKFKGAPKVIEPSVGTLTAKAKGTTATVTLSGVDLGTDDKGIPATSYSVSYRLGDGEETLALEGQTGATASFPIENLTDGEYTCSVTITTSAGKTTEAKSVAFVVNTSLGDFDALKEAIEGASQGQTVTVEKGTYYATSTITVPKGVTVVSAEGPGVTIIDGGYPELTNRVLNVNGSRATISGLTFQNACSADAGGAIYVNNNYHYLTITNCVFENCHAKSGGAVAGSPYYGDYGSEQADGPIPERGSEGVISGCTFVDCEAYGTVVGNNECAGAVFGAFWFENSTFDNCSAYEISAVLFSSQHMMITNCTFKNCPDVKSGSRGAIFVDRAKINLTILDCTFVGMSCNKLFGTQNGNGYLTVDRCVIDNCAGEASTSDNPEWKLMDRGVVRNSLVCRSKKPFSVFNQTFENCTIVDNVGGFFIKFQDGHGIATAAFTNCVWANNTKWDNGAYSKGCIGLSWHGASQDADVHTGLSFCHCAFGNPSSDEKMQLIYDQADTVTKTLSEALDAKGAKFRDPENGDYTLKAKSPLRNVGVTCDWMTDATDLAGKPRVNGDKPDLGCYEWLATSGLLLLIR